MKINGIILWVPRRGQSAISGEYCLFLQRRSSRESETWRRQRRTWKEVHFASLQDIVVYWLRSIVASHIIEPKTVSNHKFYIKKLYLHHLHHHTVQMFTGKSIMIKILQPLAQYTSHSILTLASFSFVPASVCVCPWLHEGRFNGPIFPSFFIGDRQAGLWSVTLALMPLSPPPTTPLSTTSVITP